MFIFSDVDGTLFDNKSHFLPSTLNALNQLEKKGIPFVIVSGRIYPGIVNPILKPFGLHLAAICTNGACAYDENGKQLFVDGFSVAEAIEAVSFIEEGKYDVTYHAFGEKHWIVKDENEPSVKFEKDLLNYSPSPIRLVDLPKDELILKLLVHGEAKEIDRLVRAMKTHFENFDITTSHPFALEIMKKGINKGVGIRKFLALKGEGISTSIAFGDNYNDVEMLNCVATPILMGNAPKDLKQIFPNITADNESDGIYLALKKMGVIE